MWIPQLLLHYLAAGPQTSFKSPYPGHQLFKLNDGNYFPSPAFGCALGTAPREDTTRLVLQAFENGYLHLDGSRNYGNEAAEGEAIAQSGIARENLYITSKYDALEGASVQQEINQTLTELQVEYLDMYLVHSPRVTSRGGGILKVWTAFEELQKSGIVKSIGVSNFKIKDLEELMEIATVTPAVNQIEYYVYNAAEHEDLIKFSNKHGILTEAYGALFPLKEPGGSADSTGEEIAEELSQVYGHDVTVGQMILDWLRTTGIAAATTSSKASRLQEMLAVYQDEFPPLTKKQVKQYVASGKAK